MNPIGDVKGFMISVIWNIVIVFGIGYMGGSITALAHLDKEKLSKMLPTDITQPPYTGKKNGFSFTKYSFPYTLYENAEDDSQKILNWLVITCMLVFSNIRSLFKYATNFPKGVFSNFLLFYIVPYLLLQPILYGQSIVYLVSLFVFLYAIFGGWVFDIDSLKNGLFYFMAPLSFSYMAFKGNGKEEGELGIINILIKMFMVFMAFCFGWVAIFLYFIWWHGIAVAATIYYAIFILTLPYQYGFEKVITEMGKYRLSLTIIFMLLTIQSSQSFLVSLATTGVTIGSIYMVYLLIKNKKTK